MHWRMNPMANSFDVQIIPKDNSIQEIFIRCRTDICPFCKAQRIELISFNGYPQNYRDAVNEYIKGNEVHFNKYEIRAMKCQSCKHEFVIDWSLGFPVPLTSTRTTNQFFSEFVRGI